MKDRRGFLKSVGLGALAATPLATAAVAASGKDAEITQAINDALGAPPTEGDIETLVKAVEQGVVSEETGAVALGFGREEVDRAKGRFYDMGVDRPRFISPPEPPPTPYRWAQSRRRTGYDLEDMLTWRVNGQSMQLKVRDQGLSYIMDVMFTAAPAITKWHYCFIDNAGFTAMCHTDHYDCINQAGNGWDEFTGYTVASDPFLVDNIRPQMSFEGRPTVININQVGTIKGFALVGGTTQSVYKENHDSDGILFAMGLFPADICVVPGDELTIEYE